MDKWLNELWNVNSAKVEHWESIISFHTLLAILLLNVRIEIIHVSKGGPKHMW